jgi:hypothetical protein
MKYIKTFEVVSSRKELSTSLKDSIEPALFTVDEYMSITHANKSHGSDVYQIAISDGNTGISDSKLEKHFNILNTIKHGSVMIKYYVRNDEESKGTNYVKTDDNNEVLRDKDGNVIYLSKKEEEERGIIYDHQVIAVLDNHVLGSAQDEWGATLVQVVHEFKGLGIGKELVDIYRGFYPGKSSGGTSPLGYQNLKRFHARQVSKYLRNGIYSDMVRNKEITNKRVREILDSIKDTDTTKDRSKDNLLTKYNNLKHNKAILYEGTDIMLINDRLLEYYKDYDQAIKDRKNPEDVYEKFVFGHTRIHDEDYGHRLYFLEAHTVDYAIETIEMAASFVKSKFNADHVVYYLTENSSDITRKTIGKIRKSNNFEVEVIEEYDNGNGKFKIKCKRIANLKELKDGTRWFYGLEDKYGELKDKIAENVYSTFQ